MLCNFTPATLSQFAIQVDTAVLPALEVGVGGGEVHQALQGHLTLERHKASLRASLCQIVTRLCIISQSDDSK